MVQRKVIRQHLKRMGQFALIINVAILACVLSYVLAPTEYIYSNNSWDGIHYVPLGAVAVKHPTDPQVLFDPHSHTVHSDGVLSPEQSLRWHMAMGFNACVVSDHSSIEGALEARAIARQKYNDSIKVLLGCEWTSEYIHLNLIGISADFEQYFTSNPAKAPFFPTITQVQEIIQAAHAHGGIVMLNHYIPGAGRPTFYNFVTWGVDLIEVINDGALISTYTEANAYCDEHPTLVGKAAGTDMHEPGAIYGWTALNVTSFTEEAIFNELVQKRTAIVVEPWGSPVNATLPVNPAYTLLKPLIFIGEGVAQVYEAESGINWLTAFLLIAFIFVEFYLIEVLRFVYLKTCAWRLSKKGV
jgi:predicted metal-dependent phosphoesterase TrpH